MSGLKLRARSLALTLVAQILVAGWCTPASAGAPRWTWPLSPRPDVVAAFDPPDDPWGSGHRGIDLQGRPGQPVLAVAAGTISFAGRIAGRGVVVVQHGAVRSTYEPVVATVDVGDTVDAAERIATLTSTGSHCLPAACLHLGAKRGDTYLDPMDFLGGGPIRLKPLSGDPDGVNGVDSPREGISSVHSDRQRSQGRGHDPWGLALAGIGAAALGLGVARAAPSQARG